MIVKDYNNLISVIIGISIIIICCLVSYIAQKCYFSKCPNQVKKTDNNNKPAQ